MSCGNKNAIHTHLIIKIRTFASSYVTDRPNRSNPTWMIQRVDDRDQG